MRFCTCTMFPGITRVCPTSARPPGRAAKSGSHTRRKKSRAASGRGARADGTGLQQENERLRRRNERLRRENDRLKQQIDHLEKQLAAARRAGRRQAAPFAKDRPHGRGGRPGRRAGGLCGRRAARVRRRSTSTTRHRPRPRVSRVAAQYQEDLPVVVPSCPFTRPGSTTESGGSPVATRWMLHPTTYKTGPAEPALVSAPAAGSMPRDMG